MFHHQNQMVRFHDKLLAVFGGVEIFLIYTFNTCMEYWWEFRKVHFNLDESSVPTSNTKNSESSIRWNQGGETLTMSPINHP